MQEISDLTVAYSVDLGLFPVSPVIRQLVTDATGAFEAAGATVERVELGYDRPKADIQDAWQTLFQVSLAALDQQIKESLGVDLLGDHRDEIDPLFARIVERGRDRTVMSYKHAAVVRTSVFDAIQRVFSTHDLLVTPTTGVVPFDKGTTGPTEIDGTVADPFLDWILTWPFNMTGHPAASIPAGFTASGLPAGLQLVGQRFADTTLLAASGAGERHRPWDDAYPP